MENTVVKNTVDNTISKFKRNHCAVHNILEIKTLIIVWDKLYGVFKIYSRSETSDPDMLNVLILSL